MTVYSEHPVTPKAIDHIFYRLWARGEEELKRHGISNLDARTMVHRWSHTGPSGVICADDVPVCVCGVMWSNEWRTWFQATEEFDRHASKITRVMRREVRKPQGPVYLYSVLCHPDAERWYGVIGFKRDDWEGRTAADWPLFRFVRDDYVHVKR